MPFRIYPSTLPSSPAGTPPALGASALYMYGFSAWTLATRTSGLALSVRLWQNNQCELQACAPPHHYSVADGPLHAGSGQYEHKDTRQARQLLQVYRLCSTSLARYRYRGSRLPRFGIQGYVFFITTIRLMHGIRPYKEFGPVLSGGLVCPVGSGSTSMCAVSRMIDMIEF